MLCPPPGALDIVDITASAPDLADPQILHLHSMKRETTEHLEHTQSTGRSWRRCGVSGAGVRLCIPGLEPSSRRRTVCWPA